MSVVDFVNLKHCRVCLFTGAGVVWRVLAACIIVASRATISFKCWCLQIQYVRLLNAILLICYDTCYDTC